VSGLKGSGYEYRWALVTIGNGVFFDYVGLALGIVFGLTSTFLANRQPGLPILPWTLLLTFVSVLIDFAKRLKQLKAMAPQQLVRPLGRGNEVLRDVLDLTRGASLVKNTFILFNLSESDALSQGYSEEDLKYIKTSIRDFVHRYGHWHDIVSPDVINLPRINWHSLVDGSVPRYRLHRVRSRYPVINFLLIQRPEALTEVVFGWGHHLQDPTGNVFASAYQPIVKMFEHYWEILIADSVVQSHQRGPIDALDLEGAWFRVAYHVTVDEQADALRCLGHPPADVALVFMTAEDSGRKVNATGYRYVCEGDSIARHLEDFQSVAVDLVQSRLWFATKKHHRDEFVAGWYDFLEYNRAQRLWKFLGEFSESALDHTSAPGPRGKLVVYGCRLMYKARPDTGDLEIAFDNRAGLSAEYRPYLPKDCGDHAGGTRRLAEKCLGIWAQHCPWAH